MERIGKTLNVAEIVEMNRRMLEVFGGRSFVEPNNFANQGSLFWVLDAISGEIFGVDMFPTIGKKAAALAWHIIAKHVFNDANKRTGMVACATFLEINGYNLLAYLYPLEDEALKIALGAALKQTDENYVDLDEFTNWVEKTMIPYDYSC